MAVKVAINGFGRIGRLAYRAMVEQGLVGGDVEVVAVGTPWLVLFMISLLVTSVYLVGWLLLLLPAYLYCSCCYFNGDLMRFLIFMSFAITHELRRCC